MPVNLRRSFVVLAATAMAMGTLLALLPAAGHDQLWFLLMARRWLGGAQLYGPEVFDSNPPLIVWLSAVPVTLARACHLPATSVAKSLVLLLYAGVARLLHRLLPEAWHAVQPGDTPALSFAFVVLVCVLPARDFGQRDALAGILVMPYVLSTASDSRLSPGKRLLPVLLAAFAFCLKPQDSLIGVAVEAFALWTWWSRARRERRGEWLDRRLPSVAQSRKVTRLHGASLPLVASRALALALCGGTYVLAAWHYAPLYFKTALPLLHDSYWAIGHLSLPALCGEAVELLLLTLLTALVLWRSDSVSPAVACFFAAGLGGLAAYLVQSTGWYYQQLPALSLVGGALTLQLLDLLRRHPFQPGVVLFPALTTLCVLAVALTTHCMGYPFTTDRAFDLHYPDPAFFEHLAPGTPVAILTTSVDEAMMPVERFHLTWAQRTNNLWLLPAILRSEAMNTADPHRRLTPLELARLKGTQRRWMTEDLTRWQPSLVLVERCGDPHVHCQVLEDRHDDLLAWFEQDQDFRGQWRSYRFLETRDRFDAYERLSTPP